MGHFYFCIENNCNRKYVKPERLKIHVARDHNKELNIIPEPKEFIRDNKRKKNNSKQEFNELKQKYEKAIEHINKTNKESNECVICFENVIQYAFNPCGHAICCENCFKSLKNKKCPICRCYIKSSMRIYL